MPDFIGTTEELKAQIRDFLTTEIHLRDRDIGSIVAESTIEALRYKNTAELSLSIFWATNNKPPFFKPQPQYNNKRIRQVLTLSGIRRSALDWENIKTLAGKLNNYGKHKAIARLDNGSKLTLYAGSIANAQATLTGLITGLTDCKSLTWVNATEVDDIELSVKTKDANLYKPTVKMYPYAVALINKATLLRQEQQGRQLLDGRFDFKYADKMPLWWDKKPSQWDEWVRENTKRVGDTTP